MGPYLLGEGWGRGGCGAIVYKNFYGYLVFLTIFGIG